MRHRFRWCCALAASVSSLFLQAASPAAADAGAAVVRHGASVSAANALIAEVRVSLTRAAWVFVEYENPLAGRYRTAPSEAGAEHVIPIVRLRPETTYEYTIFVAGDRATGGRETAAGPGGRFTTGRLPPALAAMPARATGRSSQPLILSDYRRGDGLSYFVFWDETGAVVWYHHEPPPFRAGPVVRLPGGNFFFRNRSHLTEITPLGEEVNRFRRGGQWGIPHHDVTALDDGRVIYPSREVYVFDDSVNGGSTRTAFLVDNLRVWDPRSGRVKQVWDAKEAWDILDPEQRVPRPPLADGYGWTHVNSVSIGPRGNVILSSHTRNQVVALSPDFRTLAWQLGGPDSDYEFPNPGDRFYRQHTASQLANGNVLVFDNGSTRPDSEGGRYSRALELRLDDAAGTARKVWEYRPQPDLYTPRFGSAYRLSNGNTLVNFSVREPAGAPLPVVEVDAAGAEVFRFENLPSYEPRPQDAARYRAYGGITAIMGETMLRAPAAAHVPAHAETVADGFTVAVDPARFRALAAAVEGARRSAAGGPFDLYLVDGRLVYAKAACADEDVAERFFLHLFPAGADDSAALGGGFDNLDFWFVERGERWQGACLAAVTLPDYAIARIRTGQYVSGQDALWSVEFPGG